MWLGLAAGWWLLIGLALFLLGCLGAKNLLAKKKLYEEQPALRLENLTGANALRGDFLIMLGFILAGAYTALEALSKL